MLLKMFLVRGQCHQDAHRFSDDETFDFPTLRIRCQNKVLKTPPQDQNIINPLKSHHNSKVDKVITDHYQDYPITRRDNEPLQKS